MHDGEAEDGEDDHGAVEDHEEDLVVGHVAGETLAELDGTEDGSDEEEDGGGEED